MTPIQHLSRQLSCTACLSLLLGLGAQAFGQTPTTGAPTQESDPTQQRAEPAAASAPRSETVYVWGRATRLTGEAQAASEGVVGYADFETRPLLRAGELVEVIPGMAATQHSGGGKANQYFLRGFNLDHGTDFAGSFDAIPLNLRSHAHMSGYLDINFLIPEIIQSVEFRKGVHYADEGDFSAAGAARFRTYDRLPEGFVGLDLTTDGEFRGVIADSVEIGERGDVLYALQYEGGDGPFDRPEELKKVSGFLKVSGDVFGARGRASLTRYDNSWFATDQIPLRAVKSGLIGRFGTLDPTLGGETSRTLASASLEWNQASLMAYVQSYSLDLYGNPTFFLNPAEGDQFVQVDDRWSWGARGHGQRDTQIAGVRTAVRFGADVHTDVIDEVALYKTRARIRTGTIRRDEASVTAGDAWADMTLHWSERLRTTLGARADLVAFDVTALQAANSGDGSKTRISPKASLAYRVRDGLELYASYGRGFHTNDPRGVALSVDPVTGESADPVDLFVDARGGEVGFRYEPSSRFNISATAFALELDSESIFVGDAGTSEPSAGTRRSGLEVSSFWQPRDWLVLDATAAWSHARFRDAPEGEDRVPNSVEFVAMAGATVVADGGWEGSLRVRHLGEAVLIETGAQTSEPTTILNLGVSKDLGRFEIGLDVLNLLDAQDNDITYFYESRLRGETAPVEDIHFHPVHPRSVKLILRADF
jgi:outer membrane receptor protein involved in Fe transport